MKTIKNSQILKIKWDNKLNKNLIIKTKLQKKRMLLKRNKKKKYQIKEVFHNSQIRKH